jgi:PPOX class probable F420-dependent enzyme
MGLFYVRSPPSSAPKLPGRASGARDSVLVDARPRDSLTPALLRVNGGTVNGKRTALAVVASGTLVLATALLVCRRGGGGTERPTADEVETHLGHPFDVLRGHEYVRLTTFRQSGEPVHTPVWFARLDGRLYVTTDPHSGKMKRIRNNDRVVLTPCTPWNTPTGESVGAVARPFADDGRGERVLKEKYGWKMSLYRRLSGEDFIGQATLELSSIGEATGRPAGEVL